jgi:CDP-diacylglycerol--glycerol-3-phosphate 3-phosphatidyltransferase
MLTISNSLSFIRAPLAFLFLCSSPLWRFAAVVLAMVTDSIDGYLARRSRSTSRFGAILDPAMDKFFVYFCLTIFLTEGKIDAWQVSAMLSRDFFLAAYGLLMITKGKWKEVVFRAIRWGKATTALQFVFLIALTFDISFPWFAYLLFVIMGWFAFLELFQAPKKAFPT